MLPEPLLKAGLARHCLAPEAAEVASNCFAAFVERDGAERAEALAREWGRAKNAKAIFKRVEDELLSDPLPPPFPETARLRWFHTKAELREAARRYRNCLADRLEDAVLGEAVFGEWLEAPPAVVQLSRDGVFGWRLAEARAAENRSLTKAGHAALLAELSGLGIHVGRSGDELRADARSLAADPRPWEQNFDPIFPGAT